MKRIKNCIIIFLGFVVSCSSPEPELFDFEVTLKNESENILTVTAINSNNEVVFQQILNHMESSESCTYRWENFQGFNCSIDSISVIFENGKGYACDLRSNGIGREFCFSDLRSPLISGEGFRDLGDNKYEFIVISEDPDNAHDLPE